MAAAAFWKTRFGVIEWNPSGTGFTFGICDLLNYFSGRTCLAPSRAKPACAGTPGLARRTLVETRSERSFRLESADVKAYPENVAERALQQRDQGVSSCAKLAPGIRLANVPRRRTFFYVSGWCEGIFCPRTSRMDLFRK